MKLPIGEDRVKRLIRLAIEEDVGTGDVTTESLVPVDVRARAKVVARADGIVAGLGLIEPVIGEFTADATVALKAADGDRVSSGQVLAVVEAPARALLSAERTVLNFLQRLSGIATLTRRFVEAVRPASAEIFDTRKTTPGLRVLEKYAVRAGGGQNHRMGLHDQVLIKDNHLKLMASRGESLTEAVARIRTGHPDITIEVEADTEEQVRAALEAGADVIMLDNMTPEALTSAVALVKRAAPDDRPILEASGGVTLENVRAIAGSGVDRISVGALTHSVRALDIAIELEAEGADR